jgi:hypothetical protein
MVPHVPVCMYAHMREGDMHIAERVKKRNGTKWDRDQASCANEAPSNTASATRPPPTAPTKINASAALSGRFSVILKRSVDVLAI